MRIILIAAVLAAAGAAGAEDWTIEQKTRDECAKEGGCLLTIPDGHLIKVKDLREGINQIAQQAVEQGAAIGFEAGKQTCGRKDI